MQQQMMNGLPDSWKWMQLKEIGIPANQSIIPSKYGDEVFELWSVPNFEKDEPEYLKGNQIGSNKVIVQDGDILLCKINPRINRVWKVRAGRKMRQIASTEWIIIRNPGINSAFIVYQLQSQKIRNELLKDVSGVGGSLMRARPHAVKRLMLAVPPKNVQNVIVCKIEELFSELDKGVEELRKAQEQLKVYRQAVLKWAFEGRLVEHYDYNDLIVDGLESNFWEKQNNNSYKLGFEPRQVPSHWKIFPIGNVFSFQQGMQIAKKSRLTSPTNNALPILRIKNYKDSFKTDVEYIHVDENSLIADKEDLIVTRTGESRGNILTGFKGVFHNNTFRINYPKRYINRKFLLYFLSSAPIQQFIKEKSGRTGQPDLTHRNFGPCPLLIPPLREQISIVEEIESRLSVCDKIEETINNSLKESEVLRQSILKKAFEGKL
jgi:type I restriction enzyme, S subunit